MAKKILILLGGSYHDFEGFAAAMGRLFEPLGYTVESTYDFDALYRLRAYDLLISYTCLTQQSAENANSAPTGFLPDQVEALVDWVQQGGSFLAAHAATIPGSSGPELTRLIGGSFLHHPPEMVFTVLPLSSPHPITEWLAAFEMHDELYIESYDPSVQIHMIAEYQGVACPVAWSKAEGRGKVAHIALGHSEKAWVNPAYQGLMLNAAGWLLGKREEIG